MQTLAAKMGRQRQHMIGDSFSLAKTFLNDLQVKKESRRELQCKDDELEDARAASGKKVTTLMTI